MERLTATPAGVQLGPIELIPDNAARNFVLEMRAGRFHGFIVRRGDNVFGFVDRCAHVPVPLAQQLDGYLTPDGTHIQCSWHGALYRIEDGRCVGGPCTGSQLLAWPVAVREGMLVTIAPPVEPGETVPASVI